MTMSAIPPPSPVFWLGGQVYDRSFRDHHLARIVRELDHCGPAICVDFCRFHAHEAVEPKRNYYFEDANFWDSVSRWSQRTWMQGTIADCLAAGKVFLNYMGGIHAPEMVLDDATGQMVEKRHNFDLWEGKRNDGDFIKFVENCMSPWSRFQDNENFFTVVDGGNDELCWALRQLGHRPLLENAPWPGHACRSEKFGTFTSDVAMADNSMDSTSAKASGEYHKLPPGRHHVHPTNTDCITSNCADFLRRGLIVHAGQEDCGVGRWPTWYPKEVVEG